MHNLKNKVESNPICFMTVKVVGKVVCKNCRVSHNYVYTVNLTNVLRQSDSCPEF